jgi:presenilin-like A22 family membrane protease
MQGHHPEFVYNMVINFSFVIGQTFFIKLVLRFSYATRLYIFLISLIVIMAAFPFVIEYTSDDVSWGISIAVMVLIGKIFKFLRIVGICLGTLNSVFMGIAGLLEPKFIGANL